MCPGKPDLFTTNIVRKLNETKCNGKTISTKTE